MRFSAAYFDASIRSSVCELVGSHAGMVVVGARNEEMKIVGIVTLDNVGFVTLDCSRRHNLLQGGVQCLY